MFEAMRFMHQETAQLCVEATNICNNDELYIYAVAAAVVFFSLLLLLMPDT